MLTKNAPKSPLFFCAIGGSGMMPLACAMRARGFDVRGSDRGHDQGRTPERFAFLEKQGIRLFPQDGSGITPDLGRVIVSSAIEKTVPDYQAALGLNIPILLRAQLLAEIFNEAATRIAIAGTSGKSTTTGMIGWILHKSGYNPTVINGAAMKNFVTSEAPFASAVVGSPSLCVAEVDESDGSIDFFTPSIAVLNNISLDHKSLEELRNLFQCFIQKAAHIVLNLDNDETERLSSLADLSAQNMTTYSLSNSEATLFAEEISFFHDLEQGMGTTCYVTHRTTQKRTALTLNLIGHHNVSNALASIGASIACGVPFEEAAAALQSFSGISRRMDVIGSARGITVIDDFAHNPDKITACLRGLHQFEGRLFVLFQPHGFGPLRLMRNELTDCFSTGLKDGDQLYMCDPLYLGGTTDRSVTSQDLIHAIQERGKQAHYIATRENCAAALLSQVQPTDRIIVMGARDDTLPAFARSLFEHLKE